MIVLAALDQRLGLRYTVAPTTDTEINSYLRQHLKLAGRDDTLFSDDASALIHQISRGYPRAVDNVAVPALVAAFAADKAIVDEPIIGWRPRADQRLPATHSSTIKIKTSQPASPPARQPASLSASAQLPAPAHRWIEAKSVRSAWPQTRRSQ